MEEDARFWRVSARVRENSDLITGFYVRDGDLCNRNATLLLTRPGPWMPPITCISRAVLVISDECKRYFETLGFDQKRFLKAQKSRIVEVHDHYWAPGFEFLDGIEGIDPSTYLLAVGKHSVRVADEMGPIWELSLPCGAYFESSYDMRPGKESCSLCMNTWTGWDVFFAANKRTGSEGVFVTELGKCMLEGADTVGALCFDAVLIA